MAKTWDLVLQEEADRLRRQAAERASGKRVLTHVPTSFVKLDQEYGGIRMGVVTELMAHTGDGKSAFVRQCTEGAARSGSGVLWFVAEDPRDATAERQFAAATGIGSTVIGRHDVDKNQLDAIRTVARDSAPWAKRVLPVFEGQDVTSVLDVIDGTTTVGGAPLQAVFIDYAQVLGESDNLERDIAELGKGLHQRSRERGFATLIGSQVSTDVIKRGRDAWRSQHDISQVRPSLGDTEWCRRLEKLCKAVWSLFRPGRWMREFGEEAADDRAELHVIKSNFGPMGWVSMNWDGPTCRFY